MSMDPNQPYGQQPYGQQQAPFAAQAGRWGVSALGNIGAEVMAGLAYVIAIVPFLGFIAQIIIFAMEKNRFVKFHAAQALSLGLVQVVLFFVYIFLNGALSIGFSSTSGAANAGALGLGLILACVEGLIGIALFAFWIWGMIAAFT
ncbi:MAG: hypothetical protein ACRDID_15885, partial [Ktedonobacterales bacterium]